MSRTKIASITDRLAASIESLANAASGAIAQACAVSVQERAVQHRLDLLAMKLEELHLALRPPAKPTPKAKKLKRKQKRKAR